MHVLFMLENKKILIAYCVMSTLTLIERNTVYRIDDYIPRF